MAEWNAFYHNEDEDEEQEEGEQTSGEIKSLNEQENCDNIALAIHAI